MVVLSCYRIANLGTLGVTYRVLLVCWHGWMDGGKGQCIKEGVSLSWSYKLPDERSIGSGQIFSLHNVILCKDAILIATIEADTGHCSRFNRINP